LHETIRFLWLLFWKFESHLMIGGSASLFHRRNELRKFARRGFAALAWCGSFLNIWRKKKRLGLKVRTNRDYGNWDAR
jgi:hypothetical protein